MCEGLPNELLSMSPCDLYVHLSAKYATEEQQLPKFVEKQMKKDKKEPKKSMDKSIEK